MRLTVCYAACALSCALFLTGCGIGPIVNGSGTVQGTAIHGVSMGGRAPISGQKIYLMEAVTTGFYASGTTHYASKSLLTSAAGNGPDSIGYYVLTGSDGTWTITGDYACDAGAQAYVYGLGGNSGSGTNTGIGLMAALGQCPSSPTNFATADPFVNMDEVTTVAAAYAMAGYATDATHVSSDNNTLAKQGIANAFANAGNLATISTGVANTYIPTYVPGHQTTSTVPQSVIDTLGNILAACVNSATGSANCATLFTNAKSAGSSGTAPTDTATAAINIAHNPGNAIAALYGLQPGSGAPFQPHLSSQPNDFTVGIQFTGSGLAQPVGVAVDVSGNAWVANSGGNSVTEIAASGASSSNFAFNSASNLAPIGIAIDAPGNVWVSNYNGASVAEFSSSGALVGGDAPTDGSLNVPFSMVIDGSGNIWVGNYENSSFAEFTSSGSESAYFSPSGGSFGGFLGIAIDTSGNAWVTNYIGNSVTEFTSSGGLVGNYAPSGSNFNGPPAGITIDASGNAWVGNYGNNSVVELNSSGGLVGNYAPSGSNFNEPFWIVIDGSGNVWVGNYGNNSVTELTSSGSLVGNYKPSGSNIGFLGIAIDGSGNAWVTNRTGASVTELVGAATPVVTPMVANLKSPYGAHAVNVP